MRSIITGLLLVQYKINFLERLYFGLKINLDATRVRLQSDDETDDLDYINAVFVDGYRKKSEYLVTQIPMSHTTADFWRMIYQNKSPLIVMLNSSEELNELNVGFYWNELSEYCEFCYGEFDVQVLTSDDNGAFMTRVMKLTNRLKKNEDPLKVVQLQYKEWSSEMKPASMLKLLQITEVWRQRLPDGPITVHCMDGATRSGLFVASRNVCDQIVDEDYLDVYQVVKAIRTNRPEFIPNSDQYRFLFELAQEIAEPILKKLEEPQPTKKLSFKM